MLGPAAVDGGSHRLLPRDRVVLAALAMSPRTVVTRDRLADALWTDDPPATWTKVLQGSVVRIRKALGSGAVRTVRQGYVLDLPDDAIDALRFEELFRRARELLALREPDRARYALTQALDLWYGPALADLEGWSPGEVAAGRWEELRRDAEELRVEASLATGGGREVLTEAGRLVADQPFRENRWALLARAQYQAGRQGEALSTLQRARAVLAGELGLDPGPELAALEQAILHQDPDLIATTETSPTSLACPYRGLLHYDVDDAERYFGREAQVAACLDVLARERVVAVIGPSGSGKSSLVRAGVAAGLRREGRSVAVMTPGAHPMSSLAQAVLRARGVLVVDQLEEVFTLCADRAERAAFLDTLAERVEADVSLVLTLRADRLGALPEHPRVARTVERGMHLLGSMSEEDLRSAVEGPARQAGLLLEPGLVDLLVHEVSGEPGALPLLSHALAQTWERREGRTLTVEGYRASGGIQGAVARSAEDVFLGLTGPERRAARTLLLRLVVPVGEGEPTRGRVARRVVASDAAHEEIVEMLVAARLVTSDGETVELAHESLARAWPRLRGWLDDDTDGQRILRHLTVAADSWAAMGRPDSELYRGTRLAQALEWRPATAADLTGTEREFLDASDALARAEARSAEERLREQTWSNRRLRGLLAGVVALLVVALVAGGLALRESDRADTQASLATVRELAAASRAVRAEDSQLSVLLALEATDPALAGETPAREAVEALHGALAGSRLVLVAEDAGGAVAWSPDGRFLATEGPEDSGLVEILDATTGEPATSFPGHEIDVNDVAFGPAGQLATAGDDGAARIWAPGRDELLAEVRGEGEAWSPTFSTRGRTRLATLWPDEQLLRVASIRQDGEVDVTELPVMNANDAALSPDGRTVAVGMGRRGGALLDARSGDVRGRLPGHKSTAGAVAFSPDGRWVAAAGEGGNVVIHDAANGEVVHRLSEASTWINAVAWSPDSRRLATSEEGGDARVYDVTPGSAALSVLLAGASSAGGLVGLAFSPDGSRLLGGDLGVTAASVWDVGLGGDAEVRNVRGARDFHGVAFGPDGRLFTVADRGAVAAYDPEGSGEEPVVRLAASPSAEKARDPYRALTVSPDGSAVGVGISESGVAVWDLDDEALRFATEPGTWRYRPSLSADGELTAVASDERLDVHGPDGEIAARLAGEAGYAFRDPVFSPDGRLVVALRQPSDRGRPAGHDVVWWDWRSDEVRYTPTPMGHNPQFSPDGSQLAIAAVGAPIRVLDVPSGEVAHTLEGHDAGILDLAFSPDGRRIATGGLDGVTMIWDAADGTQLLQLPKLDHEVSSLAFGPDSRHLATDSVATEVVRVWTLDVAELRRIATEEAARDLTPAECRRYLHRACG